MTVRPSPSKRLAVCLAAVLIVGAGCRPPPADSPAARAQLRRRLIAEFQSAYPKNAPLSERVRSFHLRAAPTTVQLFEGQPVRVWAYNDQVPGPVLRARLGETIAVHLQNELPQPTTIHWHGMRVPNAMDGVPGVTQAPVPPGGSFDYRFVPKDPGTFWFHPHVRTSEQVERGLYGVVIVDDRDPLPYTKDVLWVLDDWRLGPDGQIDPRFVTRGDLAHDGRWGGTITVNGAIGEELRVPPGARIRLRLVNTSNGRAYAPDFEDLDAKVIAVDGMYTKRPLDPVGFRLAPGNRLDLDITFDRASAGKTFTIFDRFSPRRTHVLASIRVVGEAVDTPRFRSPSNPKVPSWAKGRKLPVDETYVLNARRGGPYGIQWTINGEVWGSHTVTQLPPDVWTHVRFQNDSARMHPMHLHGQFFKVLTRNGQPVDEPYFRDTVLLLRKESVEVGMIPMDWGKWMMHCHILEHAEAGMMTLIDVGEHDPPKNARPTTDASAPAPAHR